MSYLRPDNPDDPDTPETDLPQQIERLPLTIVETPTEEKPTNPDAFQIINGIRDEHFGQKPPDPRMNAWIIEKIRKRFEI